VELAILYSGGALVREVSKAEEAPVILMKDV
jgi:hypothetical protein